MQNSPTATPDADPLLTLIATSPSVDALNALLSQFPSQRWSTVRLDALRDRLKQLRAVTDVMRGASVATEAERIRVRTAARAAVDAEQAGTTELPDVVNLADFLQIRDDDAEPRIDRLWPAGGRVLLSAQYKAGKTHLLANLVRSLADGDKFLGQFVPRTAQRIVVIDNELDPRMIRQWLREQAIVNMERVDVVSLKGKVGTFNVMEPATRARWARQLGKADVLILDCLRPVLDAVGLSEDKDAGRFLVAFDALLAEAGITEAAIAHHMGHSGERARGDSRLRDWPDAEWRIIRETDEPNSARYFSAFGRDVDLREQRLIFEPLDRSLTLDGGSRRDAKIDSAADAVKSALAGHQGEPLSGRAIIALLADSVAEKQVRAALKRLIETGEVLTERGEHNATLHYLNPSSVRQVDRPDLAA